MAKRGFSEWTQHYKIIKMGYSNYKNNNQIEEKLGINYVKKNIFVEIKPIQASEWLKTTLSYSNLISSQNEKTKSETIVSPILTEVIRLNKNFITLFSGSTLDIDTKKDLNGECDFVITKNFYKIDIKAPIFQIVEAKDHDIKIAIPQCAAQMYAADVFNKKANENIDCIYGCVTTGDIWLFMKLYQNNLFIDNKKYYLNKVDKILGVFQNIIDTFK